jgi:hypothetical protein
MPGKTEPKVVKGKKEDGKLGQDDSKTSDDP